MNYAEIREHLIAVGWTVRRYMAMGGLYHESWQWRSPAGVSGSEYLAENEQEIPPAVIRAAVERGEIVVRSW